MACWTKSKKEAGLSLIRYRSIQDPMTTRQKLLMAAVSTAVLSMGGYLIGASLQSQHRTDAARSVIENLAEGTTTDTSAAILRLIAAQDETLREQVDGQLNVLREVRIRAGSLTYSKDLVAWTAMNQFTRRKMQVFVPKMLFGGHWLGINPEPTRTSPIVDEAARLVGGTMTIFQRMDERGDMLRVATNVRMDNGQRAIGTYIPATNSDGLPNQVVSKVLSGGTFRGVAWVVNAYYVADYEPLRDKSGCVVGMLYAGEKQESGVGLRSAISSATVGKTGTVVVLAVTGDKKGKCLISADGRDGRDLSLATDANGDRYVREILTSAAKLKGGRTSIIRYTLGTKWDPIPIAARVAYYAPWGWAVVTEAHQQDFAPIYARLRTSGRATVVAFLLIGGAMLLISLPLMWAEATEKRGREAERANRAKSEFLSRMSHELRTPMNAILGFAQILQLDELSPDQSESVTHILRAGDHLLSLINEVLDISKVEAGAISISLEPVSIRDVARDAKLLVNSMAERRGISVELELGALERAYVLADRQRLAQVTLNLASNAVKFNRQGGRVEITAESQPDGRIRIQVSDTGPGIPLDKISELFVPFARLGQTEVEGTGLGLALSKGLVEAMGGIIGFETSQEGSSFFVDLARAEAPSESASPSAVTPEPTTQVRATGERLLLLIEDELSNVRLIERLLSSQSGLKLIVAMQGTIGYDLALEHRPDLILLDLNLPDCNGFDLLRRIRQSAAIAGTKVIVLSADATQAQKARLAEFDAIAYLAKPFVLREFLEVLELALGPGRSNAA